MRNIKQKLIQMILSFICIICLVACQMTKQALPVRQEITQEAVEIAILMPVSDEQSAPEHQYNQLIKMGLEDGLETYAHVTSYNGSDEQHVLEAMAKIIARKTKIILGPLYSNLTSLISNAAKANNIIIITMSNNPVLADDKLFVFGHAPLKQLTRIINYCTDNNYKKFITLLPTNQYSQTINQIIQNMLIQKNATLLRSEFYCNAPESIEKSILIISNSVNHDMPSTSTMPVIYLSGDSKNLHLVFNSIKKHNLDKKAIIIGDNRINIDYPEHINIMFTGSLNILNSNIIERIKHLSINHLSFMHAMAYDLGRMTANYIGTKFSSKRFVARMNNREPYIGVSGNIHFIDSIAQRQYDIIKMENGIYSSNSQ